MVSSKKSKADQAAAALFSREPPSSATSGSPRDFHLREYPVPSTREIPRVLYTAGNPEGPPFRRTPLTPNSHCRARLLSSAPPHPLQSPRPVPRHSAQNRRPKALH